MTLLACGINHLTTPIQLRERMAFTPDRAKLALKDLIERATVNEAMILSTCNRVEIYTDAEDASAIRDWLASFMTTIDVEPHWYFHQEQAAVHHIMRVASGLDSMVLGEPQILGQMKEAYSLAREVGTVGSSLQRLFQRVFNVTKQVRTETQIGANPITLGFAAVTLAKRIFSDLSKRNALLIGAGEMIELCALHLFNQGVKRFVIASRSDTNARQLAEKLHGHWISLSDVPIYLPESDIVITATASELPLLGKGTVERAIKARKHRPIFMMDLAVPRDIEPEVGSLEDIYLYNIDDLKRIVNESQAWRQAAAKEAENVIELQARHFMRELQSLNANHLIASYKQNLTTMASIEVAKACDKLAQGAESKEILQNLAYNLVNKISHTPCVKMKQAAYDGRLDLLAFARQLLDLD